MAFINKKNRVIDVSLTDYGRKLLSTNQLEFVYYCFSDELIDYSGSLAECLQTSASLDDVVYKNYIAIESTQVFREVGTPTDLSSFLFTTTDTRDVLPLLDVSSGSILLSRTYEDKNINDYLSLTLNSTQNKDVVLIAEVDPVNINERQIQYAAEQKIKREVASFSSSGT